MADDDARTPSQNLRDEDAEPLQLVAYPLELEQLGMGK